MTAAVGAYHMSKLSELSEKQNLVNTLSHNIILRKEEFK
jgi:hypothetical protein